MSTLAPAPKVLLAPGQLATVARDFTAENGDLLHKGMHVRVIEILNTSGSVITGPILKVHPVSTPIFHYYIHQGALTS